jgi:hypothetical protein
VRLDTTAESQTVVVVKLSPENAATAQTKPLSTVEIGTIVHSVKRLDITVIKNVRSAEVSDIFS